MGKILFEGLEFYAYHGVFPEEQVIGANYLIDLEIDIDFSLAASGDDLDGTIDYSELYAVTAAEMDKRSKLIEHVADRIVKMLFVTFKKIDSLKIKITKMKPPIPGNVKNVSVIMQKSRNEL